MIAPIEPRVAEHLARVGGAQLALDTPEYNCHTTGSDALFAGVPLLTLPGEQMASRVARSLVAATASLAPVRSLRAYEAAAARARRRAAAAAGFRLRLVGGVTVG